MSNAESIRQTALSAARLIYEVEIAATSYYFYLIALGLAPGKHGATNPHLVYWMIKANIQSARDRNPIQILNEI
jgi:hypothetical protein